MPVARPPVPKAPTGTAKPQGFPPKAQEADDLLQVLAQEASVKAVNDARLALSGWTDSVLEMLAEVERGPISEDPLEEVWHWLAASERLARSLSFAEHFSVAGLASRLESEDSKEVERWHHAVRQLRMVQKESSWNARYLRVIEEPLARLNTEHSEQLPRVLAALLRSLRRIHSSSQIREHCMVRLLQKVLKVLVSRAGNELPPVFQVAATCYRADEAMHFRDGFQCFVENYFLQEDAAASSEKLVASTTPRRPGSADRARQNGLGWWRATVRHSQELAKNSTQLCGRMAGILTDVASLRAALPQLQRTDAGLKHEVQGFLELYSGARSSLNAAELLDLKRCHEAQAQLSEVQERLDQLTARCEKAGIDMCLDPGEAETTAEVLTLDASTPVVNVPAMQESIHSLQEDLDEMGNQLENFSQLIDKASFAPPSRLQAETAETAETLAAQEVARRSSWFHRPPAVVPKDVPLIQVKDRISQRVIRSCPSRPRTAQPAMVVMSQVGRPHTADGGQVSLASKGSDHEDDVAVAGSEDIQDPPEELPDPPFAQAENGGQEETEDLGSMLQYECSWHVS